MPPLTKDIQRPGTVFRLRLAALPVAAGETIHAGAMVCVNAAGMAVPAADTAGLTFAGLAYRGFDNANGADGVIAARSERYCEVDTSNYYAYEVAGTAPTPMAPAFVVDDNTVSADPTTENIVAGRFIQTDRQKAGRWLVDHLRA